MAEQQEISLKELEEKFSDLNSRLKICHEFSNRGFFEHAIDIAEENSLGLLEECSNLTSLVDMLRSSGAEEFVEQLEKSSLAAVDEPYYQSLQDSYERVEATKTLRNQLKKLVLLRAPAPCRLGVMREWLSIDPTHPTLESDVRELEKLWIRQVVGYCRGLVKDSRTEDIIAVGKDLFESGYAEQVPGKVVEQIKLAVRASRLNRLPSLEKEIQEVHNEQVRRFLDEPADVPLSEIEILEGLFVELDKLLEATKTKDSELVERLNKSRRWHLDCLAEEKLRKEKIAAKDRLSRLIQNRKSNPEDIEAALQTARTLDVVGEIGVAEAKAAVKKRTTRTRDRWRAAGLTAVVLAVAIPTIYFSISSYSAHEAAVAAVIELVNEDRRKSSSLGEALQKIEDCSESVQSDQRVVQIRQNVSDEIELLNELNQITNKIKKKSVPQKLSEILRWEEQVESIAARLDGKPIFQEVKGMTKRIYEITGGTAIVEKTYIDDEGKNKPTLRASLNEIYKDAKLLALDQIETLSKELNAIKGYAVLDHEAADEELARNRIKLEQVFKEGLEYDNLPPGSDGQDQKPEECVSLTIDLETEPSYKTGYLAARKQLNELLSARKVFSGEVNLFKQGPFEKAELERLVEKRNQITVLPEVDKKVVDQYSVLLEFGKSWRDKKLSGKTERFHPLSIPAKLSDEIDLTQSQVIQASQSQTLIEFLESMSQRDKLAHLWEARDPEGGVRQHNGYFVFEGTGEPGPGPHENIGNPLEKMTFRESGGMRPAKAIHQQFSKDLREQIEAISEHQAHLVLRNAYEWLRTNEDAIERMPPESRCHLLCELIQAGSESSIGLGRFFDDGSFTTLTKSGKECPGYKWALADWSSGNKRTEEKIELSLGRIPEFSIEKANRAAEVDRTVASQTWIVKIVGVYNTSADTKDMPVEFFQKSQEPMKLFVLDPENENAVYSVSQLETRSDTQKRKFSLMPVIALPNLN